MTPRLLFVLLPLAFASAAYAAEPASIEAATGLTDQDANSSAASAADDTAAPVAEAALDAAASADSAVTAPAAADEDSEPPLPQVRVADPFIDLHTGPGRGFPKFQIVERGGLIQLLKRRTDWFLVRTPRGHEGWVNRDQLIRTLTPEGEQVEITEVTQDQFANRTWEFGVMSGEFESASVISMYGAWGFTENLSLELTLGHVLGNFSNAKYATLHLTHQPFPEWWISPYFQLGTGYIQTDPAATIVQTEDRSEQLTHVGVGARTYLTRRFVFRVEYNNYVVLTDRNDNEKVEEWKAGFSLFF
ncbi:hypothetical protein HPT27_09565 [Permianibacter sp. IMCC34836]|uniref:hypothetical protein n=1 Tax=Permianibacter fluminis TaxID=2738515 RepID=UPI0015518976|nr:hypothetical protein [Permianibacter fluminis]NQD37274.1 hypothetical protein [Permianibacter fluminis]